jgi:dihydroxy-acid dehydratase
VTAVPRASSRLDGDEGFAARSFLRSGGLTADQVRRRPVIGIATSWSELNPCNLPTRALAQAVKRGVTRAGGIALEFPTISLAEALIHPTTMLLRNLMAMDVEEMITASPIDAVVLLGGCDKTVAAQLMGALSADKPALSLTTGPRPAGHWRGRELTIDDSWRLADERRTGLLDGQAWTEVEGCLSPAAGVCNVMGTAVTLAMIAEILGFAPPGSSLLPAHSPERTAAAEAVGARAVEIARAPVLPSTLVTRDALADAWRLVCAVGGSTNAAIHLQALAGRAGVELSMRDFRELSETTPTLAQVRPNGPYTLDDLHDEGGVPALVRELGALVHPDRPTADGASWRTAAEAAPAAPDVLAGSGRVLHSAADPVHPKGALTVLHGSLAPASAVIKRSAATPALLKHTGPALVFDGLDDLRARIDDPDLPVTADSVLVLRGAGPLGGPGMAEVGGLPIPAKLYRAGVRDMVRISDARMSGTAAGTVVLHIAPEAAAGGPLALVRDGDPIRLDVPAGRLDLLVDPAELLRRAEEPPAVRPAPAARGYRLLYARHVTQADQGCDFDFLRNPATLKESP